MLHEVNLSPLNRAEAIKYREGISDIATHLLPGLLSNGCFPEFVEALDKLGSDPLEFGTLLGPFLEGMNSPTEEEIRALTSLSILIDERMHSGCLGADPKPDDIASLNKADLFSRTGHFELAFNEYKAFGDQLLVEMLCPGQSAVDLLADHFITDAMKVGVHLENLAVDHPLESKEKAEDTAKQYKQKAIDTSLEALQFLQTNSETVTEDVRHICLVNACKMLHLSACQSQFGAQETKLLQLIESQIFVDNQMPSKFGRELEVLHCLIELYVATGRRNIADTYVREILNKAYEEALWNTELIAIASTFAKNDHPLKDAGTSLGRILLKNAEGTHWVFDRSEENPIESKKSNDVILATRVKAVLDIINIDGVTEHEKICQVIRSLRAVIFDVQVDTTSEGFMAAQIAFADGVSALGYYIDSFDAIIGVIDQMKDYHTYHRKQGRIFENESAAILNVLGKIGAEECASMFISDYAPKYMLDGIDLWQNYLEGLSCQRNGDRVITKGALKIIPDYFHYSGMSAEQENAC